MIKFSSGGNSDEKVELQMTPMIDIVFQLLSFFALTFRIVSPEGDFNIRMPLVAPAELRPNTDLQLPPIKVRLKAADDGGLAGMQMNDRTLTSFKDLQNQIRVLVGGDRPDALGGDAEVELDCDHHLKFEYVIRAVSAVSGYVTADGQQIVRLVDKVKFAPPRKRDSRP